MQSPVLSRVGPVLMHALRIGGFILLLSIIAPTSDANPQLVQVTPDPLHSTPANNPALVLADHPQGHATLCEQVKKIGPPRYFPAYMVNHGMSAMIGALSNQAPAAPLKADFNAAATWTELQFKYLNCTPAPQP